MAKIIDAYYPKNDIEKIFLNSIWRLSETDFHKRKEIILPKGTVELIFNFSDTVNYNNPSLMTSKKLPAVFVNGLNFRPFELVKTGHQDFLGIQLNSIGLRLLFNISAKEFNNNVFEVKDFCPYINILAEKLCQNKNFNLQVEIILNWIYKKISACNFRHSINRFHLMRKLIRCHDITVKKLSEAVCLSERQLRRFSNDWAGMNTEEFILYNKYLVSLHLLHNSKRSITDIGLEAGYFDQSHFIREFKSYTDLTPKQYQNAKKEIPPGHIFV